MSDEEIDKIIKKVFTHPNAEKLEIKRIPKNTVKIFKDFANEEFVGDYGMALKFMVDNFIVSDPRIAELWLAIDDIRAQLSLLPEMIAQQPVAPKPEPKSEATYKTMLNGRKILIKE